MIDERSQDGTGWAMFSHDRKLRFRLARALKPIAVGKLGDVWYTGVPLTRVVFVMLNPSIADAFQLDPTVQRCVKFAQRWDAEALEVVNLFALRSPHPRDVWAAADRGDGSENDAQILAACRGAARVIAAWGNGGEQFGRAARIRSMLGALGVQLHHLGLSQHGHPKHPLARGTHRIPDDVEPQAWPVWE